MLVFVGEIDALLSRDMRLPNEAQPDKMAFGNILDGARAERPDAVLLAITPASAGWIGAEVRFEAPGLPGQRSMWADPESGEIIGQTEDARFRKFFRSFHDSFLTAKSFGGIAITAFSIPLLFFIASGLIVYRRFWKGFLRFPSRANGPRAFWGGLHRLLGLWTSPFLLVIAFSSLLFFVATLGFDVEPKPEIASVTPRAAPLPFSFDGAALEQAIERASVTIPGFAIKGVGFPRGVDGPVEIMGEGDTWLVGATVFVDPVTLDVVGHYAGGDQPLGFQLYEVMVNLHYGTWGGQPVRWLWLVFGALATTLTGAGAMIYASKTLRPATDQPNAIRRVWSGMSILKWCLIAFILAIAALFVLRVL